MGLRVFLTDGHYKHSLAALRSLSAKGLTVDVGSHSPRSRCFYSAAACGKYILPNPQHQIGFVDALCRLDEIHKYDAIVPIGYETWAALVFHGKALAPKMALPTTEAFLIACNKIETFKAAQRLGIPTPDSRSISDS